MKYCLLVWGVVFLLFSMQTHAAVRGVEASERSMTPIFLNLGKSTVLRFRDKPRKVVVGNRNYFNIEFIENDLAIQPLGPIVTNLFVYAEAHTYGFILKSGMNQNADDLVHVVWAKPVELENFIRSREVQRRNVSKSVVVGKQIRMKADSVAILKSKGLRWAELRLVGMQKKAIPITRVAVALSEGGAEIPSSLVCDSTELNFEENVPCRLFFKSSSDRSKKLQIKIGSMNASLTF